MKIIFLIITINIILYNPCFSQDGNLHLSFNDYFNKYSNVTSGIINFKRKFKEASSSDTAVSEIDFRFQRADKLSVGYLFDIQISGYSSKYRISYDGNYFYFLSDGFQNISIYETEANHEYIVNQLKYYTRNLPAFSDYSLLLDNKAQIVQSDSIYHTLMNQGYTVYISKKDSTIQKITETLGKKSQNQFIEIEIAFQKYNIDFGKKWLLNDYELPSNYFVINQNCKESFKSKVCEGIPAPRFTTNDITGKPIAFNGDDDKITILDFWYIDCPPCKKVAKILDELNKEYGSDIRIIGINSIDKDFGRLQQYCSDNFSFEQIWDPEMSLRKKYDVHSFPSVFVINAKGIVVYADNYHEDFKKEVIKAIEENQVQK